MNLTSSWLSYTLASPALVVCKLVLHPAVQQPGVKDDSIPHRVVQLHVDVVVRIVELRARHFVSSAMEREPGKEGAVNLWGARRREGPVHVRAVRREGGE